MLTPAELDSALAALPAPRLPGDLTKNVLARIDAVHEIQLARAEAVGSIDTVSASSPAPAPRGESIRSRFAWIAVSAGLAAGLGEPAYRLLTGGGAGEVLAPLLPHPASLVPAALVETWNGEVSSYLLALGLAVYLWGLFSALPASGTGDRK